VTGGTYRYRGATDVTPRQPLVSSRRLRRKLLAGGASLALVFGLFAFPNGASADPLPSSWSIDQEDLLLDRQAISLDDAGITDIRKEIDIFIRLDEPAVTEFVADEVQRGRGEPSAQERRAQAQRVTAQQDRIRDDLARLGIEEQSAMRVGANGLRVRAQVQEMPALADLPGVVSVAPVTLHEPTNESSVPWINAPQAWEALGGTGEGIIVSVIDTGIDYTHASFGGSGDPADYDFIAQDTTVIPEVDGEPVFPTAKVIRGTDFVGVTYNAGDPENNIPEPDPNPIDVNGHGTHVAGSATGAEVTVDGDVTVGSGVAPGAVLYAAKVFGDIAGSTAVTADAIEWSLDPDGDGSMAGQADVINMSLGSLWGNPDDPSAIASQNATEVGTVVVASAGNSGHSAAYVTGSPAVAPGAISVAASIDGGIEVLGLEVHEPAEVAGVYEAAESAIGVPLAEAGPLPGDLAVAEPLNACTPLTNPDEIAGKIAFVQRGVCTFAVKHLEAQAAGATGIVVFNNMPGDPFVMGGDSTGITIPGVMVSLADGNLLKAQIDAGQTVSVTMSTDIVIPKPELADLLAGFTSRGPGGGSIFKPDVAAPGFGIDSAAVGGGTAARTSSGTSMAAPHVAGLAALLAQQHGLPDFDDAAERAATVRTIKSLIVNTTVPAADDYPLALQGAGVVRADRAVDARAYTTPGGLSFGRLHAAEQMSVTESVEVSNLADGTRTFDISFEPFQQVSGVSVSHDPQVTVGGGDTASFDVTIALDPAAMPADLTSFSQTEVDGWLVLDDGSETVRTGVLAVVDPAATLDVTVGRAGANPTSWQVDVSNAGATAGVTHGFTLVNEGDDAGGVTNALGVRTATAGDFDVVQFGLATDAWESLSSREIQVLLDPDRDGDFEYMLVAADLGLLQGVDPTGQTVTALFDLSTDAGVLEYFVAGDYHDAVQVLTVDRFQPVDDNDPNFGFLPRGASPQFDYLALTFERGGLIGSQEGTINLAANVDGRFNPSLSVPAGMAVSLEYPRSDVRSLLWLHPTNLAGEQSETVSLPPRGVR
jgi:subtilisin family serine protease